MEPVGLFMLFIRARHWTPSWIRWDFLNIYFNIIISVPYFNLASFPIHVYLEEIKIFSQKSGEEDAFDTRVRTTLKSLDGSEFPHLCLPSITVEGLE